MQLQRENKNASSKSNSLESNQTGQETSSIRGKAKKRSRDHNSEERQELLTTDVKQKKIEDDNNHQADGDNELENFFDSIDAEQPGGGEDFSTSVGNEAKPSRNGDQAAPQNEKQDVTLPLESKEEDNVLEGTDKSRFDGDEMSQAAYEARLAKLMLMSRRKNGAAGKDDGIVNAVEDASRTVGIGISSMADINEGTKKTTGASPSYKDIMKKKQKKKHNPDQFGSDDDAYWANF
jgi:hypothetical protein